jgi:hypothetical protein
LRILVVEDETLLSGQLASALGQAGYAVDCAADGERADFLGQTESYDAVVLDLGLPRIDGMTLLRRWRDAGFVVPVLVLTARCFSRCSAWWPACRKCDAACHPSIACARSCRTSATAAPAGWEGAIRPKCSRW